jgi:chromosome segregation ATPase
MLDQKDIEAIGEIVDSKTSDIRQDVSVLKQDVSKLKQDVSVLKHDVSRLDHKIDDFREESKRHMHVLVEEMSKNTKLIIEGFELNSRHNPKIPKIEDTVKDHDQRIVMLEKAFKRKKSA